MRLYEVALLYIEAQKYEIYLKLFRTLYLLDEML